MFLESDVWEEYLSPEKLDDAGKQDMIPVLTAESDRVVGTADPTDPTLIQPME